MTSTEPVGICGDTAPTLHLAPADDAPLAPHVCELPAGHRGWHHGRGCDWGPLATTPAGGNDITMDAAGYRYWNDADFHGRVYEAACRAEAGQPDDGYERFHRDSLIAGAAMALQLADVSRAALLAEQPGGGR